MRDALVSAQRAADELKARTKAECDDVLAEARADAARIEEQSRVERERTESEIRRLKAAEQEIRASYKILLAAALDRLDEPMTEELPKPSLLDALAPRRVTEQAGESPQKPASRRSSGSARDDLDRPERRIGAVGDSRPVRRRLAKRGEQLA